MAATYAERLHGRHVAPPTELTACLIAYGDGIRRADETPLHTLAGFLHDHVGDVVSDVHLLPMFPWTSDDGFAVVDHREVNPALGTWADVADLAGEHDLMFDFVANHTSSSSPWFRGWLARDPAYDGFYVEREPDFDVSHVTRPRTTPLFHAYPRPDGTEAWAWTTFGEDQVDVDVRHPRTLLELTDVLLGYLERGASAIRLDAIGFLWKESGTTCIHLPQTHAVIKLWRALVEHVAPGARLLTETNVPARREHLLLRRRRRRGPPRLPVRAAAAGAALLRRRLDRRGSATGLAASGRSATPRRGSTSSPATTASGCVRPRASSPTPSAWLSSSALRPTAVGFRWPAGPTARARCTS